MTPNDFQDGRAALGWSQSLLAEVMGYSSQARISNIETGSFVPTRAGLVMEALLSGWRPAEFSSSSQV